jgi:AraC-like DNA-binding protein
MDPLSHTLSLLRPQALLWKQARFNGDWAVRFPGNNGVAFCLIAAGNCRFETVGQAPQWLQAGDFVLLARPPEWTLSAGAETASVAMEAVRADPERFVAQASASDAVQLLGGHFAIDPANGGLLDGLMPGLVHIRGSEPSAKRVSRLLALIADEAQADRPGQSLVLDRLLEIMLVEAIRHAGDKADPARRGLPAGLADPHLATALHALHADSRRDWTVAQLAALAGMSRSAFSDRFARVVGLSPIDYLLRWRMALAKEALRFGGARLAEVAEACGYQSVSAFSAAFRRIVGSSPGRWSSLTTQ